MAAVDLLTFEELSSCASHYDEAVLRTRGIDHFCSSSFWILPAARHLSTPAGPWIWRRDDAYVALARTPNGASSSVLHPLEAMWALASPLAGAEPDVLTELFIEALERERHWHVAVVAGVRAGSKLWKTLVPTLRRRFPLSRGPVTRRYVVDLSEGVDGFLKKRSPSFRKNLRKAERRARELGLTFELVDDRSPEKADASFDRLLAIEKRSWKGRRGVGIDTEPMQAFYRDMNRRLVARGARRLLFATIDGEDVAYIFGAVLGKTYRGLQFSFDHRFASYSLGNLCQLEELRRLSELAIESYDLGTEVAYKKRWGDSVFATSCLFVGR